MDLVKGAWFDFYDASGKPVFYEYDWRGNLSGVRDENGNMLAAYAHTPGGKLKEIRHGNGLCTRYEYDTDGNMIHLHFQRENGETISDLWYEYDLNGNRTLKTGKCILSGDSLTDLAVSYRYDSMDRLTSESRDGEETAYSYDFCGNRLKKRKPHTVMICREICWKQPGQREQRYFRIMHFNSRQP